MSLGFSPSDFVLITQLAFTTVQNARKACGAHDGLTREVSCLHIALKRLESEASRPESLLNSTRDDRKDELSTLIRECSAVLKVLSKILEKYNALSEETRSVTKLWQRVKFGNGEMQDLSNIRLQLVTYTSAITMFINTLSLGSQGKVEEYMTLQGGELQRMRRSLNWIIASLQASSGNTEGSLLTSYTDDDKAIWKDFRRELIQEGYSSNFLQRHKETIKSYVHELGQRGALDDLTGGEQQTVDEAQFHEGTPILREDSSKNIEQLVSLAGTPIQAATEIDAHDILEQQGSHCTDDADSVKSYSTWSSCSVDDGFWNCQYQKQSSPRKAKSKTDYMDECKVKSGEMSSSGRDGTEEENSGGFPIYKTASTASSEYRRNCGVSGDSDSDISDRQQQTVRKKPVSLMTLSELDGELRRADLENEDISRKLEPYWDEIRRTSSWRYMIKQIFSRKEREDAGVSSEFKSFTPLISRQRSIREHKASIERRIVRLKTRSRKSGPIRKAQRESSLPHTSGAKSLQLSKNTSDLTAILSPPTESLPSSPSIWQGADPSRKTYDRSDAINQVWLLRDRRKYLARKLEYKRAAERVKRRLNDLKRQREHDEQYLAFHVGASICIHIDSTWLRQGFTQWDTVIEELERHREDNKGEIERAWRRLLGRCVKSNRNNPNREEFDEGVKSAKQRVVCIINIFELALKECESQLELRGHQNISLIDLVDLLITSMEVELEGIERESIGEEPLKILDRYCYQVMLLVAQLACYEDIAQCPT